MEYELRKLASSRQQLNRGWLSRKKSTKCFWGQYSIIAENNWQPCLLVVSATRNQSFNVQCSRLVMAKDHRQREGKDRTITIKITQELRNINNQTFVIYCSLSCRDWIQTFRVELRIFRVVMKRGSTILQS